MDDVYALLAPYMHIIPWRALRPDDLVNHVKHGATKPHLIPCGRVRASHRLDFSVQSDADWACLPMSIHYSRMGWDGCVHGMQAGCYGRAFCPAGSYPRKRILQICQSLRILNALRAPDVGVPLTLPQLEALTPSVLMSRLINARRHLLALRIAEMLNMDTDKVHNKQTSAPAQPSALLQ